jgi:hypothetical protein
MTFLHELFDYLASPAFKTLLEELYFIAGVVLATGILIAIKQLKQQRQLTKIQNRRDAFKIAAERCEYFGREIAPMVLAFDKALAVDKIDVLAKCKVTRTEKGLRMESHNVNPAEVAALNKHADKMTILLNSIEGFALYFVTGVADDNVGFFTCGKMFVDLFEKHLPIYAMSDSLKDSAQSTQALYARWRERLVQRDLVAQKKAIEAKLDVKKLKAAAPYGG